MRSPTAHHIGCCKPLVRTDKHGNPARLRLLRLSREHSKYSLHPILAASQDHKSGPVLVTTPCRYWEPIISEVQLVLFSWRLFYTMLQGNL